MHIAVAQLNPTVGDLEGNVDKMLNALHCCCEAGDDVDLVVFPAHSLSGAPLQGLTWSRSFCDAALEAAARFCSAISVKALITVPVPLYCDFLDDVDGEDGVYDSDDIDGEDGVDDFDSVDGEGDAEDFDAASDACFLCGASEVFLCDEGDLLPLGFADEDVDAVAFEIAGKQICVLLDRFLDEGEMYPESDVLVMLEALPFSGAGALPLSAGMQRAALGDAARNNSWLVFANLVGGQDEELYPGGSFVMSPYGDLVATAPYFDEATIGADVDADDETCREATCSLHELGEEEALWQAACLATRDYVHKNGFTDVVVGVSGGIDSAVVATLAVDALGAERVHAVSLPGPYTSEETSTYIDELTDMLDVDLLELSIEGDFALALASLEKLNTAMWMPESFFDDELSLGVSDADIIDAARAPQASPISDLTQQNLQARLRSVYLMALSNQYGWMLLNTGNRSEQAVGFSTLYGDTCGSFSPFGSIYKTRLIELIVWRNTLEDGPVVPQAIIDRPPTAELRLNQKDSDTLPVYEELDAILALYLDEDYSMDQIVQEGFDAQTVARVLRMVGNAEFKRRQEPLSPTFGALSLCRERDWPICNRFRA